MKKTIVIVSLIIALLGCTHLPSKHRPIPTTTNDIPAPSTQPTWAVYDPDPNHPWNRVFRQLYRRMTADGKEYGTEELDPLLWFDTTYFLTDPFYQQTIQVLEQFLATHAENLIQDPRKRAMFQRDLWVVFDWLAARIEPFPAQRQALETRLAQIIKRVALSKEEILSLPDNYALALKSRSFPDRFQAEHPEAAFLPADLFQADSPWVLLGREIGPLAMTHTRSDPFLGHSVFLVFLRSPNGREATLDLIESFNTEAKPVTATGSEVALVRRMLLIDRQGELILSLLVEMIQLRHFSPRQSFYEFELSQARLFAGQAGGLVPKTEEFMVFMSHGDVFEKPDIPDLQAKIPDIVRPVIWKITGIPELSIPEASSVTHGNGFCWQITNNPGYWQPLRPTKPERSLSGNIGT